MPSYASLGGLPRRAQGLGFPGADSSRGRTSSIRWCLLFSVTYFLLPVLIGAAVHVPVPVPVPGGLGFCGEWNLLCTLHAISIAATVCSM